MYCSVLPSISLCLIPTTTVRERRQGAIVTGGGPSGVLRPLADASESANQCDLGIGTERGVTHKARSNNSCGRACMADPMRPTILHALARACMISCCAVDSNVSENSNTQPLYPDTVPHS